mmetsp:Transcript_50682/g.140407  ORF Transcript_50682/g.140407 Transcript_50682/m.140407 type:complete len:139 (+) Transcript_50682:46-462(+)
MNVTIHLRSFGYKRLDLHGHPSSQAVMDAFFCRHNIRPQARKNYIFFNCLGLADPAKVTNHLGLHYHVQSGVAQHNKDMIRAWAEELQECATCFDLDIEVLRLREGADAASVLGASWLRVPPLRLPNRKAPARRRVAR